MRKFLQRMLLMILCMAMCVLAAACSGTPDTPDDPDDPSTSVTLKIQSAAPLKQNYLSLLRSEPEGSQLYNQALFTKRLVEGFKELCPNVTLNFIEDGWGDALYQKQQLYIRDFNAGGKMAVDIMIGETIVDPNDPKPLPLIHVDDPAISMTFGTNDSPLAGTEGKDHKLTARMIKDRLDRELIGNVSIKVLPTDRPDAWEVQGRGELALAVLAEQMRREGYELTVGRPQVVTKKIDGVINEPMENTTIDVPEEYMGTVTQLMADRKGRMDGMTNHGSGWVRLQFTVPSRGLIGFRTALLSATRGTGISSSISAGYAPWAGAITIRQNGSMVSDRKGIATPYAMQRLQARGNFFVEPQSPVYEGQVVGVNNKPDELDVNITLAKHMTNMRSSTADVLETLTPPIKMSLEESLDFANEDECVEVTPESIRVRKIILGREDWYKWRAKQRRQNAAQQGK